MSIWTQRPQKVPWFWGSRYGNLIFIQGQVGPWGALVGRPACANPGCSGWIRPGKVSAALTCPWAPLLPPGPAFWPAHSLQFTPSTTGGPQVGFADFKKKTRENTTCIFCALCHQNRPRPHSWVGGPLLGWRCGGGMVLNLLFEL